MIDYGDLSEELQGRLATQSIDIGELEFEAHFNRFAFLIAIAIAGWRIRDRFFS